MYRPQLIESDLHPDPIFRVTDDDADRYNAASRHDPELQKALSEYRTRYAEHIKNAERLQELELQVYAEMRRVFHELFTD